MPFGVRSYDVSFYVTLGDNDIREMYIVRYYPSPSTDQGYIYLPGEGECWNALNLRAIVRAGTGMEVRLTRVGASDQADDCYC